MPRRRRSKGRSPQQMSRACLVGWVDLNCVYLDTVDHTIPGCQPGCVALYVFLPNADKPRRRQLEDGARPERE